MYISLSDFFDFIIELLVYVTGNIIDLFSMLGDKLATDGLDWNLFYLFIPFFAIFGFAVLYYIFSLLRGD